MTPFRQIVSYMVPNSKTKNQGSKGPRRDQEQDFVTQDQRPRLCIPRPRLRPRHENSVSRRLDLSLENYITGYKGKKESTDWYKRQTSMKTQHFSVSS